MHPNMQQFVKRYYENNLQETIKTEAVMDALFAEMLLDQVCLNFRKAQIQKEIDLALQNKNKEAFLRLTEELKSLL